MKRFQFLIQKADEIWAYKDHVKDLMNQLKGSNTVFMKSTQKEIENENKRRLKENNKKKFGFTTFLSRPAFLSRVAQEYYSQIMKKLL